MSYSKVLRIRCFCPDSWVPLKVVVICQTFWSDGEKRAHLTFSRRKNLLLTSFLCLNLYYAIPAVTSVLKRLCMHKKFCIFTIWHVDGQFYISTRNGLYICYWERAQLKLAWYFVENFSLVWNRNQESFSIMIRPTVCPKRLKLSAIDWLIKTGYLDGCKMLPTFIISSSSSVVCSKWSRTFSKPLRVRCQVVAKSLRSQQQCRTDLVEQSWQRVDSKRSVLFYDCRKIQFVQSSQIRYQKSPNLYTSVFIEPFRCLRGWSVNRSHQSVIFNTKRRQAIPIMSLHRTYRSGWIYNPIQERRVIYQRPHVPKDYRKFQAFFLLATGGDSVHLLTKLESLYEF